MWTNTKETVDLVTFNKAVLNGKFPLRNRGADS